MHFIAYGRLRNAFTMWKEELDKYAQIGEAKRARVIEQLIKASMSREHRAFLNWMVWCDAEKRKEKLMRSAINLMLKAAGLMVYNYFSRWKLNGLEKKKIFEMRHARALNEVIDSLGRKRRKNLKAGFNAIAKDSWNTNMKQRILNKLHYVCYGRMKNLFDRWKFTVHQRLLAEMEAKKAKVIDMLHWHSLGDTHRAFLRWAKNARDGKMREYGE
jgi:hypothetical protein